MGLIAVGDFYCMAMDRLLQPILDLLLKVIYDTLLRFKTHANCVLNLVTLLELCLLAGIKLGRKKAIVAAPELLFGGYLVSEHGHRPDPARLQALAQFPVPQSKTDLRSFFGLAEQLLAFAMLKTEVLQLLPFLLQAGHSWN